MVQTHIDTLNTKDYTGTLQTAVEYLLKNREKLQAQEAGKYEVDPTFFYMIQEYDSKNETAWESHKKYLDIQWVLDGEEIMEVSGETHMKQLGEYDESKDFCGWEGAALSALIMKAGDLAIFYPEDIHKPGLKSSKGNMPIRKCLFKVLIEK